MPIASSVFLGLELAVSQRIRSPIVDDSLELVVFECVDFVTLSSQNIKRRAVTPFSKDLERTYEFTRIKSDIGGSARYALHLHHTERLVAHPCPHHRSFARQPRPYGCARR
ncbi:hypothetical protein R3P38DRAFT_2898824 [Favolaschia claudopus]|uniref:Uncharacterized protein n=1 Tax=Favolaschia claudopus TaxID=2862362 RepID=A0AAW0CLT2_9AGAR